MYPVNCVTVIGPVGVGTAVVVATVGDTTVVLEKPVPVADAVAVEEVTLEAILYMLSRLPPPQYSVTFPLQSILHMV